MSKKKTSFAVCSIFINFKALDSLKFAPLFLPYYSLPLVMGPQELGWDSANLSPKEVTFPLPLFPQMCNTKNPFKNPFPRSPFPFLLFHSLSPPPPPFTVLSSSSLLFFTHRPSVYPVSSSLILLFLPGTHHPFSLNNVSLYFMGSKLYLSLARGKSGRDIFS